MASKPHLAQGPVLSLLLAATLWGVIWYPLRLLDENGLNGLWTSLVSYGVALLVGALYRRMKVAARHHWLGTAVKRTWSCAVLTALVVGLGGACLDHFAPSTHSLGPALQKLKQEWGQRK